MTNTRLMSRRRRALNSFNSGVRFCASQERSCASGAASQPPARIHGTPDIATQVLIVRAMYTYVLFACV